MYVKMRAFMHTYVCMCVCERVYMCVGVIFALQAHADISVGEMQLPTGPEHFWLLAVAPLPF